MKYMIGIDLGTSYFKAGLFDAEGRLCGIGRVEVKKQTDDGVRCEVGVADFWRFLQQAIEQAKRQANARTEGLRILGRDSLSKRQKQRFQRCSRHMPPVAAIALSGRNGAMGKAGYLGFGWVRGV